MRRALPILAALLAVAAGIVFWMRMRGPEAQDAAPKPPSLSRFDAAFQRHLTQLAQVPAFREQLDGLPPKELRAAIQSLAARGMRRLPDERLDVRTRVVGRMLDALDVQTCSAMATGKQNEAVHDAAVLVLDPASLEDWVALSFEAARAELEAAPDRRPSPTELQLALKALFERVPEADAERLRQALGDLGGQPPAEACWAARTTYASVQELPPPVARVLARELAGP